LENWRARLEGCLRFGGMKKAKQGEPGKRRGDLSCGLFVESLKAVDLTNHNR
jgi:hypothetical protein